MVYTLGYGSLLEATSPLTSGKINAAICWGVDKKGKVLCPGPSQENDLK